ncbi:MAG: FAD:protein FMN transferase [Burkholderiales bacterium]|nr:FAD:protein FMN transferase [Burkholderiales bacterium]
MACACELRLAGADEPTLRAAAQQGMAEVRRIETKYSRYRPDSVVSRINAAAGFGVPTRVDGETAALIGLAAQLHALSGGRFDITSGVLRRAWNFRGPALPSSVAVDALLPLVGWPRLVWDGRDLLLPDAGMEIDLGGLGKEYAADRCAALLLQAGVRQGWVNLGGDIRVLGPRPDGSAWSFGIRHPRDAGRCIAQLELTHGALATSGDYERFIDDGGRRYSHLLDARTGWPAQGWQSVSVQAPACVAAGAVSSIAMLMGDQALAFLAEQGLPYLAVDAEGRVHRDHMPASKTSC